MRIIAHRGNTEGPNSALENTPSYLQRALDAGFYVETDVWYDEERGGWLLGHDEPTHSVNDHFLRDSRVVCHAKTPDALSRLMDIEAHCFFHDKDEVVLTSRGWLWTYPGGRLAKNSVAVMPEQTEDWDMSEAGGVCTDYAACAKKEVDTNLSTFVLVARNNPAFAEYGFNTPHYLLPVDTRGTPAVLHYIRQWGSFEPGDVLTVVCEEDDRDELAQALAIDGYEPKFQVANEDTGKFSFEANYIKHLAIQDCSGVGKDDSGMSTPERYFADTWDAIGPVRYKGDSLTIGELVISICASGESSPDNQQCVLCPNQDWVSDSTGAPRGGYDPYLRVCFRSPALEGATGRLALADTVRGWFIGDFEPSFVRTKEFEIGLLTHEANENWDAHVHRESDEYNYLVQGTMLLNGAKFVAGEWFIFPRGHLAVPKFLETSQILCIKVPSRPGDKIRY
jgi:hypothetical protein